MPVTWTETFTVKMVFRYSKIELYNLYMIDCHRLSHSTESRSKVPNQALLLIDTIFSVEMIIAFMCNNAARTDSVIARFHRFEVINFEFAVGRILNSLYTVLDPSVFLTTVRDLRDPLRGRCADRGRYSR